MNKTDFLKQLKTDNNIFSLPQILAEILKVVEKDDFNADNLGDIILKDPALTARILKMSNSSFYNRYAEIKTVHQAVSMMGATTIKCLALSTSIFKPGKISEECNIDAKSLFNYILTIAATSQAIAKEVSYPDFEEAFIAGLLHDIGILFFVQKYSKQYKSIINHADKTESLINIEKKIFEIDHCELGKLLAESWKLPKEIVRAISNHHNLDEIDESDVLSNIVKLAVLITNENFSGLKSVNSNKNAVVEKLSFVLKLDKQNLNELMATAIKDTFEIANHLDIDIGSYEEVLAKANQEIWNSYHIIEKLFQERVELSKTILEEEHKRGAVESKNIAMATLSHYINNAVMGIYGRMQLIQMDLEKGNTDKIVDQLDVTIFKINVSVKKIVAVLEEMKKVSPVDHEKFNETSLAMNIDKLIEKRLAEIDLDSQEKQTVS